MAEIIITIPDGEYCGHCFALDERDKDISVCEIFVAFLSGRITPVKLSSGAVYAKTRWYKCDQC